MSTIAITMCVIEVNEGVVEASRQGVGWWSLHRQRFVASGRLREVKPACVVGGTVQIGPYGRDDAEFIAGYMVESGDMSKSAIKVKAVKP